MANVIPLPRDPIGESHVWREWFDNLRKRVLISTSAIPAGGTQKDGITFSSTANFGVFFGSGAPSLSAAKGSLYLRSDGSGVNNRMYINTDGGTTWTAVVTVA